MATSVKFSALFLSVLMLTVGHCFARPHFDVPDRQQAWPYWSDGYNHGQLGGTEPSSRDLDIGFSIGGDEDNEKLHSHTSGELVRDGYGGRDRRPEDFNIDAFEERPGARYEGWSRGSHSPRGDGEMVDDDGYPGMTTQPLDHKVGEVKLRNDRGYQLSMRVPPSSVGDRPGVLKIDMKATLYRPIFY